MQDEKILSRKEILGPHGVLPGKFFNLKYNCGRPRDTK